MKNSYRNVLMISFLWPPSNNVGALRVSKFAKYLPLYEWQPTILTCESKAVSEGYQPDLIEIPVVRTGYKDIVSNVKKMTGLNPIGTDKAPKTDKVSDNSRIAINLKSKVTWLAREILAIPDEAVGWYSPAVKAGLDLTKNKKFDLILSTSPPETSHLIARTLKRKTGIPWIADMRDLWSLDHYRQRSSIKTKFLSLIEKHIFRDTDALISVSKEWVKEEEDLCPYLKNKTFVIPNGYDPDDFPDTYIEDNKKLIFVYTGKLDKRHQDVEVFFRVLSKLINSGKISSDKMEFRFYLLGYEKPDINGLSIKYSINNIVKLLPPLSLEESIAAQRSASVFLLFQWNGSGGSGWHSAKVFEYLGAKKPILAINANPNGALVELIKKTDSGFSATNEKELEKALLQLNHEFLSKGKVAYCGKEREIEKYSRKELTEKLANVFTKLTE